MPDNASWLPDLTAFPDCEERRRVENLSQEMELLLQKQADTPDLVEAQKIHDRMNRIWFEANATVGALVARVAIEQRQTRRWRVETVVAYVALAVALLSLVLNGLQFAGG